MNLLEYEDRFLSDLTPVRALLVFLFDLSLCYTHDTILSDISVDTLGLSPFL